MKKKNHQKHSDLYAACTIAGHKTRKSWCNHSSLCT